MTLQQRLLLILGTSFTLLWLLVAAWLLRDLDQELQRTLDQRLAASARMISGLIAQVPADTWQQELTNNTPSFTKDLGVMCQVRSEDNNLLLQTHHALPSWLSEQDEGFSEHLIDNQLWRVYTQKTNGLYITTADRIADRHLLNKGIFLASSVPFLVALLGGLIALWLGVRRVLRPLVDLRQALSQRHPNSLDPVELNNPPEELIPVIQSLNVLLARVKETIEREQRFTSDAAHELRTPLTAIKTHLQVANRAKTPNKVFIEDAEAAVVRLQRILEQLLTLAKVESSFQWGQKEPTTISHLIPLASTDLLQKERVIHMPLMPKVATAKIAVPEELAALAIKNLLDNALRHSGEDTQVTFSVFLSHREDAVVFSIEDSGQQLTAEKIAQLTQRFWRSSQASGSGLGLAIVNAIAERFGGSLRFSLSPTGGLIATLYLPRMR